MRYTIEISRKAEKFLRGLTDKGLYRRLRAALNELKPSPTRWGA